MYDYLASNMFITAASPVLICVWECYEVFNGLPGHASFDITNREIIHSLNTMVIEMQNTIRPHKCY
jgi:hypothetical protein